MFEKFLVSFYDKRRPFWIDHLIVFGSFFVCMFLFGIGFLLLSAALIMAFTYVNAKIIIFIISLGFLFWGTRGLTRAMRGEYDNG